MRKRIGQQVPDRLRQPEPVSPDGKGRPAARIADDHAHRPGGRAPGLHRVGDNTAGIESLQVAEPWAGPTQPARRPGHLGQVVERERRPAQLGVDRPQPLRRQLAATPAPRKAEPGRGKRPPQLMTGAGHRHRPLALRAVQDENGRERDRGGDPATERADKRHGGPPSTSR
jgi:hypothetical protein